MKLYVVVSRALSTGLKCAQAVHAAILFCREHPDVVDSWWDDHNVVIVQHDNLPSMAARLEAAGFRLSRFHEPDLGGEMTALCVEPDARRMLSSLALAA